MTVAAQTPFNSAVAAGSPTFTYNFRIIDQTTLVVKLDGVLKVLATDYTVTGVGSINGGTVVFNVAPTAGQIYTAQRVTPIARAIDYQPNGDLLSATVNLDYDALWLLLQEQAYTSTLTLFFPPGENLSGQLPPAATRANKFLAFDGTGLPIAAAGLASSPVSVAMAPVVAASTLPLGRTALGSGATGDAVFVSATPAIARQALGIANPYVNDFRNTLTSNTPVTITDVVGASVIYFTPSGRGGGVALYTGSTWMVFLPGQLSLALSGMSIVPQDIFLDYNTGVPALVRTPWTSDSARATALALQDGVQVKSGTPTQRYLTTIYPTGATTTEDSNANRFLWNNYNRVARPMFKAGLNASWTVTANTWRQAQGQTANQLNFITGLNEDPVVGGIQTQGFGAVAVNNAGVAIALNNITTPLAPNPVMVLNNAGTVPVTVTCPFIQQDRIGRQYLAWMEKGDGTNVSTFYGLSSGAIFGSIMG